MVKKKGLKVSVDRHTITFKHTHFVKDKSVCYQLLFTFPESRTLEYIPLITIVLDHSELSV